MKHLVKYGIEITVGSRILVGYGGKYAGKYNLVEETVKKLTDKTLTTDGYSRILAHRHAAKRTSTEITWPVVVI